MPRIITAAFTSAVTKDAPGELVYIPVGTNRIHATVNGKPGELSVNVPAEKGAAIAATLQAALAARLVSPVRPRLAFDHAKTGPASGHPSAFSFDPARGIILAAHWSTSGRAAIEGGDYGYFSPTFLLDERTGHPCGLPDQGEIGSLVDEPAFRGIGLIAAADTHPNPESTTTHPMSKLIFAALAISPAADNAETEAVNAINGLKGTIASLRIDASNAKKENTELKNKVETVEASLAVAAKARAATLVLAAVADGRLPAKDEDKQAKFRDKIEAGDTFAEEILAQLPRLNQALGTPLVRGTDGQPVNSEARVEAAQARARAELGDSAGFSQVWGRATEIDPTAFEG